MVNNNFNVQQDIFLNKAINNNIFNNRFNKETSVLNNSTFTNMLKDNLEKLNEKHLNADEITESFIRGEDVEVHEMMLAQEEAKMSMQMAVQIRNKFVETIQELSRMQI